jgi:hypothetical protein
MREYKNFKLHCCERRIVVFIHCYMHNRMHSPNIKIINANLAYCINQYKNTKKKLLICNANIYFNKSCLVYKIIPKYARINIKTSNYIVANEGLLYSFTRFPILCGNKLR